MTDDARPTLADILARTADRTITPEDATAARAIVYGDDAAIDASEIETLFAIDEAAASACDEWAALFVEAGTDHLVRQMEPTGYIDEAKADWLMARVSSDRRIKSASELELLVKIMEEALSAPQRLSDFVMREVAEAVRTGEGVTRGGALTPGRIGAAEIALVRRTLYAHGGDGGMGVTRAEAEALFAINEALAGEDHAPEWDDLFAKAIANVLLVSKGYRSPPRETALAREAFLEDRRGMGGFMARMVTGALAGAFKPDGSLEEGLAERNARADARAGRAAELTLQEIDWLVARIKADETIDAQESELLTLLAELAPDAYPKLHAALEAA